MRNINVESLVAEILEQSSFSESFLSNSNNHENYASFDDVESAISAAKTAYENFNQRPLACRKKAIENMKTDLSDYINKMAEDAHIETGMGNVADKIKKNKAALFNTPGVEDLETRAITGDGGITLFEYSAYGVIGSITPSTNPTETIINNTISMIAAGNTICYSPHPGAAKISIWLIEEIERIIFEAIGIHNIVVCVKTPTFDSTKKMMNNPDIALLAVTGGPAIVKMAMQTGKKVIGAGAGNPPAIVDDTADILKAAEDIIAGASLDYNLPCIAEKAVVVVDSVADQLFDAFQKSGATWINDAVEISKLKHAVINDKGDVNKALIGKSPKEILNVAKINVVGEPKLIVLQVTSDDPLMMLEQLMPVLPVARVKDFDAALKTAINVEGGCFHTAVMHSKNVSNLNVAAKAMRTSIFVKNAPSFAGIGVGSDGFTTFTIATPTGEGTTSARSFARLRRCVLNEAFNIR